MLVGNNLKPENMVIFHRLLVWEVDSFLMQSCKKEHVHVQGFW